MTDIDVNGSARKLLLKHWQCIAHSKNTVLSQLYFINMYMGMLWGGCVLIKLRTAIIEYVTPASPCIIKLLPVPTCFPLSLFSAETNWICEHEDMWVIVLLHCALPCMGELKLIIWAMHKGVLCVSYREIDLSSQKLWNVLFAFCTKSFTASYICFLFRFVFIGRCKVLILFLFNKTGRLKSALLTITVTLHNIWNKATQHDQCVGRNEY